MGVQQHLDGVGGAGLSREAEIVRVGRRVDGARGEAGGDGRGGLAGVSVIIPYYKAEGVGAGVVKSATHDDTVVYAYESLLVRLALGGITAFISVTAIVKGGIEGKHIPGEGPV